MRRRGWIIGAVCCAPYAWLAVSYALSFGVDAESPLWIVDFYAWVFADVGRTLLMVPGALWMLAFVVRPLRGAGVSEA